MFRYCQGIYHDLMMQFLQKARYLEVMNFNPKLKFTETHLQSSMEDIYCTKFDAFSLVYISNNLKEIIKVII